MKRHLKTQTLTNYNENACDYDKFRRPSPIIFRKLLESFSSSLGPILSLGCGTARMEMELSKHLDIVGLDLSTGMLTQASSRIVNIIQGSMSHIPLQSGIFGGAYFMQSLHHVGANRNILSNDRYHARKQALSDAIRVIKTGPIVIIQRDPSQNQAVWFWKYFPQALETKLQIQPKVSDIVDTITDLGLQDATATPINDPMARRFYDPTAPLDPKFRRSFSDFSYLTQTEVDQGLRNLRQSIKEGSVYDEINRCKLRFQEMKGTVFLIQGYKRE